MRVNAYGYSKLLAQLCKFRISVAVALTTLTGFLMSHGGFTRGIVFPVFGVFLLASAASALNQIQEYKTDLLMPRTKKRPLPSGELSLREALIWMLALTISGLFILWYFSDLLTAGLGLLTLVWYNGIYTPLKRVSAFAAVPGGVVGALPPIIGWVAAGGNLTHPAAIGLGMFFFIGQVPHFWLLLLIFGEQYQLAGIKSLTTELSHLQIRRLTFIWIVATAVSAIILPAFYEFNMILTPYLIWGLSIGLIILFISLLRPSLEISYFKSSFLRINLYYLLIMILFSADALF